MGIRFSVIVPVYEQWHLVPRLLEALERQTWRDGAFEVVLIENGSSEFIPPPHLPPWARILFCREPGSYAARNAGIEVARGHWLLFSDADCIPDPTWLEALARATLAPGAEETLFAGAVRVAAGGDHPLNAYQIYDIVKGIPQAWYVRRGYGATANLCIARHVIERIGGFDPQRYSGGDAELCRRARAQGRTLTYLADAIVEHPARDTWQALVTKARRVKGGQIAAGSARRRALNLARTFTPPLVAVWRFLCQRHLPRRFRVVAVLIQFRIWVVDMREAVRLGAGMRPERR